MPMIHINGVDLHYHVQGNGPAIVFLHPPCIGSRVFTYLRNDLSRDHRTVMFDFRGHGRSGTSEARLTIPLLVEDTRRLMDKLDVASAYLCAYSVGTMVALEALLTDSARFAGAVLMGGLAEAAGSKTMTKLTWASLAARWRAKDLLTLPQLWSNSDNIYTYRRIRSETLAGDVGKWREYIESARHYSAVSRLPDIRQPVLLMCGENDKEFKKHARVLQHGLPNDSTAYLPNVKHTMPTYGADDAGPLIRAWLYAQEAVDAEETVPDAGLEFPVPDAAETAADELPAHL